MNTDDIINTCIELRKDVSVADAASRMIEHFSLTPSLLVEIFSTAQLQLFRSDEEAENLRLCRNELLSHFKALKH